MIRREILANTKTSEKNDGPILKKNLRDGEVEFKGEIQVTNWPSILYEGTILKEDKAKTQMVFRIRDINFGNGSYFAEKFYERHGKDVEIQMGIMAVAVEGGDDTHYFYPNGISVTLGNLSYKSTHGWFHGKVSALKAASGTKEESKAAKNLLDSALRTIRDEIADQLLFPNDAEQELLNKQINWICKDVGRFTEHAKD
jgi:hypothetical protein